MSQAEETPPFERPTIPDDPDERREWADRFTDELMGDEPGGIFLPWKRTVR